ncbi:MAG: HNH endonuclease, partial [gamma proteobacterium symbiont of Clathrolucina costata]
VTSPVQEEGNAPYDRHEFLKLTGGRWDDQDRDCQDTRAEVLEATSLIPVVYSSGGCRVEMGLWYDPYSGSMFESARDLDIDHFVPVKEAHESGASAWEPVERARFANSYRLSANLIPVWNSLNRSKGAKEPTEWLPPNDDYLCEYINRWAYVKWFTSLSVDQAECSEIKRRLNDCLD